MMRVLNAIIDGVAASLGQATGNALADRERRWAAKQPMRRGALATVLAVLNAVVLAGIALVWRGETVLGLCVSILAIGAGLLVMARWAALRRANRSHY